jgi:hypothetical protein
MWDISLRYFRLIEVVLVGWTKKRPFLGRAAGC